MNKVAALCLPGVANVGRVAEAAWVRRFWLAL